MVCEVVDRVKYYSQNNEYFIVGDNSTNDANGITNQSYNGEITILDKIKNKEIREIGQRAFRFCVSITRVTIFAKITAINDRAFDYCEKLVYINIPKAVTFIGEDTLSVSTNGGDHISYVPFTIEFYKGRTKKLYIGKRAISYRNSVSIIYPSSIEPLFNATDQFYRVSSATICAYTTFQFCGKNTTTTNMSQCPTPTFEAFRSAFAAGITCKRETGSDIPLFSLFILISALPFIAERVASNKKIE